MVPFCHSSHGSAVPYGHGPQQWPQSDQKCQEAEAQPGSRTPHQAHQVSASDQGQDLRGV